MELSKEDKHGLNTALNEATVKDIIIGKDNLEVIFSPVAVDKNGKASINSRFRLVLKPVHKFKASYRLGRWDDENAEVIELKPEEVHSNIVKFKPFPIYGHDFFNTDGKQRLHTLEFVRDTENYLSVKAWFDNLLIRDQDNNEIGIKEFVEIGRRAWESPEILKQFGIAYLRSKNS